MKELLKCVLENMLEPQNKEEGLAKLIKVKNFLLSKSSKETFTEEGGEYMYGFLKTCRDFFRGRTNLLIMVGPGPLPRREKEDIREFAGIENGSSEESLNALDRIREYQDEAIRFLRAQEF